MQRVLVVGLSGSGKTTLARKVAERHQLPFHEVDALYYAPGWQPRAGFARDVRRIARDDRWVIDSQVLRAGLAQLVWRRADTVVWLDYDQRVIAWRALRRFSRSLARREELWAGNRESLRGLRQRDHPVRKSWTHYAWRRHTLEQRLRDPRFTPLAVVRLRSPKEADRWLAAGAPATDHRECASGSCGPAGRT